MTGVEDNRRARLWRLLNATVEFLEHCGKGEGPGAEALALAAKLAAEQPEPDFRGAGVPEKQAGPLGDILAQPKSKDPQGRMLTALQETYQDLYWSPPEQYGYDDPVVSAFLSAYCSTQLVGPPFVTPENPWRDPRFRIGFTFQMADVYYPPHGHLAEETYVVLAGAGLWRQDSNDWTDHPPGQIIFHQAHESHAMWTQEKPLLAFFCWVKDIHSPLYITDKDWR